MCIELGSLKDSDPSLPSSTLFLSSPFIYFSLYKTIWAPATHEKKQKQKYNPVKYYYWVPIKLIFPFGGKQSESLQ